MDKKAIIKQLMLRPLDWITLSPFLAGATVGLGSWAVQQETGIAMAVAAILVMVSAGLYLHRLLFGWRENYDRAMSEWRAKVEKARDTELDDLYRELSKDGDPRTETLLKDLRTLTKALMTEQSESLASVAFDIVSVVDTLFRRCVEYLKESLTLWRTAEEMTRESIRKQLLEQREALIGEVEKSLENLGNVLSGVKKAAMDSGGGERLDELREELAVRLKVAEEVEERMKAVRSGQTTAVDEETYLRYADQ